MQPSTYQLIKMSNVYKNELRLDRNPSFWKILDSKQKKFLLNAGDIVLTLTGTVGKKDYGYSIRIPESNKYLINQRLVALKPITGKSYGDFLNILVKTSRFFYFFFSESKGGTGNQSNVGVEDLKKMKLSIPSLSEQETISHFLNSMDKRIASLKNSITDASNFKKGLLQKIFV